MKGALVALAALGCCCCLHATAAAAEAAAAGEEDEAAFETKYLWVHSPNVPDANGRYELDTEHPPINGHLTWCSSGGAGSRKGERRIALGSRCTGNVWLIGTTEAVGQNMGWLVTLDAHDGRSPEDMTVWGRVVRQDWVADATVRVAATPPYHLRVMYIQAVPHPHLRGLCVVQAGLRIRDAPVWRCVRLPSLTRQAAEAAVVADATAAAAAAAAAAGEGGGADKGTRWVFLDSHRNWVLGPDYATDTGWAMAASGDGRQPHQVADWRRQDGQGGWVPDPTIRFVSPAWAGAAEGREELGVLRWAAARVGGGGGGGSCGDAGVDAGETCAGVAEEEAVVVAAVGEDAPPCSKFWLEGADEAVERAVSRAPFTRAAAAVAAAAAAEASVKHQREVYSSECGAHVIYWCPSVALLAGAPAWVVADAVDLVKVDVRGDGGDAAAAAAAAATATSVPVCPGFALCEEAAAASFAETARRCAWHYRRVETAESGRDAADAAAASVAGSDGGSDDGGGVDDDDDAGPAGGRTEQRLPEPSRVWAVDTEVSVSCYEDLL